MKIKQQQNGLSLIELMVALGIGAFLIAGVIQVFLANKESERTETSLARLQENGRFALDMIAEDLRMTQYLGCNTGETEATAMAKDVNYEGIRGYEGGAGNWAALPVRPLRITQGGGDSIENVARAGSDVLSMQMGLTLETQLVSAIEPGADSFKITDNPSCGLDKDSQLIVSSCITAHLFQITNDLACDIANPPNETELKFAGASNDPDKIMAPYDTDSEVMIYQDRTWYVADTGRDINGTDVFALFRDVNGTKEEMIEGVEHMQVQFGQKVASQDNLRYVNPSDVVLNAGDNYNGVKTVRVALLMQSFENVRDTDDGRTYQLLGQDVDASTTAAQHAGGRTMRRVFSTTVAIRNAVNFE